MKTLITEFISLDGVVQAPGGREEDTDGGFKHGGWSMKFFDPEVMGGTYDELAKSSDALLQGRRTYQVSAAAWPKRSGEGFTEWINKHPEVRRLGHADRGRHHLATDDDHPQRRPGDQRSTSCGINPADTSISTAARRWCAR